MYVSHLLQTSEGTCPLCRSQEPRMPLLRSDLETHSSRIFFVNVHRFEMFWVDSIFTCNGELGTQFSHNYTMEERRGWKNTDLCLLIRILPFQCSATSDIYSCQIGQERRVYFKISLEKGKRKNASWCTQKSLSQRISFQMLSCFRKEWHQGLMKTGKDLEGDAESPVERETAWRHVPETW